MEFLILYLFISIEKIAAFLTIGGSLFKWSLIAYIFTYTLAFVMSKDKEDLKAWNVKLNKHRKFAVVGLIVGGLLFTISSLLPTKKELAVIVGGGITYQMVTSDTAKEIGGKAVELLKKQIDDALKEDVGTLKEKAIEQTKEAVKGAIND
jgi:hypothetical protein